MNNRSSLTREFLYFFLLAGCLSSNPAGAGVYKWTDEHGRVHYSDRPGETTAQEIRIKEHSGQSGAISVERKIKRQRLLQLFAEEREEKKKEKIDRINEKIVRRNTCIEARNYREEILASGYVYEEDENGDKRYLTQEEFKAHLAETEEMIEKYCS